jgi:Cu-Zn family superoxide dismutase
MKQLRLVLGLASASVCAAAAGEGSPHNMQYGDGPFQKVATVEMRAVNKQGTGASLGEVVVRETDYGLLFVPSLHGLEPGLHGFHVHQNASCQPSKKDGKITPAGAAGGHYDPKNTGTHDAPWGAGHQGDLPALYVNEDGVAQWPVLAPRLSADDLEGRALMIHSGGDNYSDEPKPLGGGGARVACGVIEE